MAEDRGEDEVREGPPGRGAGPTALRAPQALAEVAEVRGEELGPKGDKENALIVY